MPPAANTTLYISFAHSAITTEWTRKNFMHYHKPCKNQQDLFRQNVCTAQKNKKEKEGEEEERKKKKKKKKKVMMMMMMMMGAALILSLFFGLMAVTGDPLQTDTRNLVWIWISDYYRLYINYCLQFTITRRQECLYKRNIEARSYAQCCHRKKNSTYSECVSVAFPAWKVHVPYYIDICGMSSPTVLFHTIP